MAEKKNRTVPEPLTAETVYKIVSNSFNKQTDAQNQAAMAVKKGFAPVIIIENGVYKVFYAEEKNKTAAEKIFKIVQECGLNVVLETAE